MNKQLNEFVFPQEPSSKEGLAIDHKRVLYQIVKYWYLIVLSIVIALSIAFLINRYASRIYPITASVIVKEAEDFSGAELIYNNPLVNFKRNYLNEIYILKSSPLMQRVIEDLNFDIAFFREGNILTTEVFEDFPIEGYADRERSIKGCAYTLTALNADQYQLESIGDAKSVLPQKFNFGDTVTFGEFKGIIKKKASANITPIVNDPIIFSYTPSWIMAERYVRKLKAEWAEEGAGVVLLSLEGTSPKKERSFLTGLITRYQGSDLDNKNQTASRTVDFISGQLNGIKDSLRQVERQLEIFKGENMGTDLTGEALRLYTKIQELESQKAQMMISKNYYKYLIDYIQDNKNLHQIILPTSVGISDPILTDLVTQMTQMQMEIKMTNNKENPLVTEGIRRIDEIKKDIIESIRNQESTDKIKINFLNSQIGQFEKQLGQLPVAQRTLISIQRNYTLLENLYIFLLQRRSEAAISMASNTSDIVLVNPPKAGEPISPRPLRNYLIAFMVGLFLPLFAFVALEFVDTRVQSKEDIDRISTIPFIGGVGHKKSESNLAVFLQPKSALAESFRALRSNLSYFVGKQNKSIFLITSSISGEGKTFTSINLAGVLSMSGKKTLIVGADLRKPKIFSDFNLSNNVGLSTYLAGLSSLTDVIQTTSFENLDFISGGPVPPNPSELLLNPKMKDFIEKAKDLYDYIVIDTPPLAVVTDAFIIAPYADHILFLVRQSYTPKSLLKTAEEFYTAGKLKNISIVLNDIYKSGPGYGYGYGYTYGYGYGYGKTAKNNEGYYEDNG